ncbi:hypothetical protein HAP94_03335 [Acidithiobacillus ferrivorans]|jgi:hypothetical protein|nr:hypothetical protein [Acidithiobacillus ferrivorans]
MIDRVHPLKIGITRKDGKRKETAKSKNRLQEGADGSLSLRVAPLGYCVTHIKEDW